MWWNVVNIFFGFRTSKSIRKCIKNPCSFLHADLCNSYKYFYFMNCIFNMYLVLAWTLVKFGYTLEIRFISWQSRKTRRIKMVIPKNERIHPPLLPRHALIRHIDRSERPLHPRLNEYSVVTFSPPFKNKWTL